MQLRVGQRVRSAVDETELIVILAPSAPLDLRCGGHPMVGTESGPGKSVGIDPKWVGETSVGKRYHDEKLGLEVLCVKAGTGALGVNGEVLGPKPPKNLPTTD